MSQGAIVNPNRAIPRFRLNNVTPFTYRDGLTFLELIEELRHYVVAVIVPEIDEKTAEVEAILESMHDQMVESLGEYHDIIVDSVDEFHRIHDAYMADVNASLMALNDSAVAELVDNDESEINVALSSRYVTPASLMSIAQPRTHVVVGPNADYATLGEAIDGNPNGGVDIELVAGTHELASTIIATGLKDVTIRGQGRGATTILCAEGFVRASSSSDAWTICDVTIQCDTDTNTFHGVEVDYPRRWLVTRCDFRGFGGDSILYKGGLHSEASFNYVMARDSSATNGHAGIAFTRSDSNAVPTTLVSRYNYVAGGVEHGIYVHSGNIGVVSEGDIAEHVDIGVLFERSSFASLVRPYTEQCARDVVFRDSRSQTTGFLRGEVEREWTEITTPLDRRNVRIASNWLDPGRSLYWSMATGKYPGIGSSVGDFASFPSWRHDTSLPNGRVAAPPGSLVTVGGSSSTPPLWVKRYGDDTNQGWVNVLPRVEANVTVGNIAAAVNTDGKFEGQQVFNSTLNRPMWATGSLPEDEWVWSDGTTAVTPS